MADLYTPQTWHDYPQTDTPISAARLTHMEVGIDAVDAALQTLAGVTLLVADVTAYGADRTGAASSVVALRAAFAAVATAGGGTVFLPTGTYLWDATSQWLVDHSDVRILGAPGAVIQCTLLANNTPAIRALNVDRVNIEGIRVVHSPVTTGGQAGIVLDACNDSHVYRCRVAGANLGIRLTNTANTAARNVGCSVTHCLVENGRGYGISWDSATDALIAFNISRGSTNYDGFKSESAPYSGIAYDNRPSRRVRVIGNHSYNNAADGYDLFDGAIGLLVDGNYAYNNGFNGFTIKSDDAYEDYEILLGTNYALNNGKWGYLLQKLRSSVLGNCVAIGNGWSGFMVNNCQGLDLNGCFARRNNRHGFFLTGSSRCAVNGRAQDNSYGVSTFASATTVNGSAVVTFPNGIIAEDVVGAYISGPGIPASTYVLSAVLTAGSMSVTLSKNATASATVTLTAVYHGLMLEASSTNQLCGIRVSNGTTVVPFQAAITSGQVDLTTPLDFFEPQMVGHTVTVTGAGSAGGLLSTTVASYVDARHVTLTLAASTTVGFPSANTTNANLTDIGHQQYGLFFTDTCNGNEVGPWWALANELGSVGGALAYSNNFFGAGYDATVHAGVRIFGSTVVGQPTDVFSAYNPTVTARANLSRLITSLTNQATILTSGTELLTLIELTAGDLVAALGFCSGTTAAVGPTHQVFTLRDISRNLLGITGDDTSTAWGAFAPKALALARTITDAAITSASASLTSATAAFTDSDVGKQVIILGAGAAGAPLGTSAAVVTILSRQSATTVTLSANASTTVSGATAYLGTPYAVTASGLYYVGIMVAAGTPPSLVGISQFGNQLTALAPIGVGTADAGLTTPATFVSPSAVLTATTKVPYAEVR